jgi:hypothetical protein
MLNCPARNGRRLRRRIVEAQLEVKMVGDSWLRATTLAACGVRIMAGGP